VREQLKRAGCDRHFEGVMFGGPRDGEATRIRHLHHLRHMIDDSAHVDAGVHTFEIDHQVELHVSP
jgi:hypothetical protein